MFESLANYFYSSQTAKPEKTKNVAVKPFAKVFDEPKISPTGNFSSLDIQGTSELVGADWKPHDSQESSPKKNELSKKTKSNPFSTIKIIRNVVGAGLLFNPSPASSIPSSFMLNPDHKNLVSKLLAPKTTASPVNDTQLLEVTRHFNAGVLDKNILSTTLSQSETHTPKKPVSEYSQETQALTKLNAKSTLTETDKMELAETLKKLELDQVLSEADLPKLFAEPEHDIKVETKTQQQEPTKTDQPETHPNIFQMFKKGFNSFFGDLSPIFQPIIDFFK